MTFIAEMAKFLFFYFALETTLFIPKGYVA